MLSDEERKVMDSLKVISEYAGDNYLAKEHRRKLKLLIELVEKQSKEIEELKQEKDKIKEILGIEEDIDNEKLLSLLQTIVDENARLEDIEDRKVQIEYNNVFNKGVKSVEDKIKAKIEELNDGIKRDMINYDKLKDESWKLAIHRSMAQKIEIKKVLQPLLEKE